MLVEFVNMHVESTQADMSSYPNLLTPPSSSEDSPQSNFYSSPPSSYGMHENTVILPQSSIAFDFDGSSSTAAPYLRIIEHPIDRFRFRYKSEMTGTHGSLCGLSSDRTRKQTFPTVELCNFNKKAIIRCSIYQINTREDQKPHAHRLIKKQGRAEVDDPHDVEVTPEDGFVCTFHNMGIIHTAKKNIVGELLRKKVQLKKEEIARLEGRQRELTTKEEIEIKGLAEGESKSINLNVVCLRFDAYYNNNGILLPICRPIYSKSINNLKSALTGELKIVRMDHCTSPAKGGREVFILVERVTKKNIKIRFFELDDDDSIVWEDYGKFTDLDVHHQYAIVFKTPPYKDINIKSPVKVYIELVRPSDNARSEPKEFTYIVSSNMYKPGQKRARPSYSSSYDTSLASDELPVPINNLYIENTTNMLEEAAQFEVTSAELQHALSNINSDEFEKLFNDFGPDYCNSSYCNSSIATDAPLTTLRTGSGKNRQVATAVKKNAKKLLNQNTESIEETAMARQAIMELKNFIKTRPSDEKAINMLKHYLSQENRTNSLHVAIRQNDNADIMFLLKMIYVWKQPDLLNVQNDCNETPLHIATYMNLEEVVTNLIICKADVAVGDTDMNTALHYAVMNSVSIGIFEKLLSVQNVKYVIDLENNDGNTALNLAIENGNLKAIKILCRFGADINKIHKKNGYTPLRFAIEKQNVDVVRYIIQHKDLNAMIEDFQDVNPLQAALRKENRELLEVITDFMRENNFVDCEIKNEIEDPSDEEFEEKFSVKLEQITPEELRDMYSNVRNFTSDCLDEISKILDLSGTWQNLADLLDLGHLLRPVLNETNSSPTKLLLKLAIETNGDTTILQIRDFLENLDENQAVEIIDNMVKSQFV